MSQCRLRFGCFTVGVKKVECGGKEVGGKFAPSRHVCVGREAVKEVELRTSHPLGIHTKSVIGGSPHVYGVVLIRPTHLQHLPRGITKATPTERQRPGCWQTVS